MKVANGEAEACAGLEAARGGVHPDGGGCKGIVGWEHERAPVLTAFIGSIWRPGEDVVPF